MNRIQSLISAGLAFHIVICCAAAQERLPLSPIFVKGAWGYMDSRTGEIVIKPQYERAGRFALNLAPVRVRGRYGYIDQSGQMKIKAQFLLADTFTEGTAAVMKGEEFGYIRPDGEWAITPRFRWAAPFHQQRACVLVEDRFGYADPAGELVIPPRFAIVRPFSEGYAAVSPDGKRFGFIDKSGRFVVEPQFEEAGEFRGKRAWVQIQEGRFGFIGPAGNLEIAARFDGLGGFSNGIAPARVGNQWCFVNDKGALVTEPVYDSAESHPDAVFGLVGHKWATGRMSREGTVAWELREDTSLVDVRLESEPIQAAIYKPTLWEYEHAPPNDKSSLLIPQYRISRGDTNTSFPLSKLNVYMIIFVRTGKQETRKCEPEIDDRVFAKFQ